MKHGLFLLAFCTLFGLSAAQFQFFDNFFGQQQQQQQQHSTGASQYAAFSENGKLLSSPDLPCSQYLCPATLDCVAKPTECPCPNVEDIKCLIPDMDDGDATVVCVRGGTDCSAVEKQLRKFGSPTKTR